MADKTRIVMGTATPGGGFPAYGDPYARILNEMDDTLAIETRNTKGSNENIVALDEGRLDLGLVTGEVTYEAVNALGRPKAERIRIINATYSQAGMFMVLADSPYRRIADLAGKRIVWGAASSGFIVLARYVMDGLGYDFKQDFDPVLLEKAGDGPPQVIAGSAAAMWGGGVGWPPFLAIARDPRAARFIAPSSEEIARIQARHSFLKQTTMPERSYPGQASAIASVGSWPFVLARASLPDEVAYRLARALHRAQASFAQRLEQARESTLENTLAAALRRDLIHPGVLRYMREIGLAA
ncbi:MAG: TAXI family TRAP transporter solute-binding subunit [Burkholderiales bacterium]|nr:TAXI family TRAP transporter solute-binding subunit [Burkholderiales bacterium]